MIVFQVPLSFNPAKEILKIQCNIMQVQVTMKAFAPPFFNHFSLSLYRKKICGNESHEKESLEAVARRYPSKKVFLKDLKACNFIKRRLQHRCFLCIYNEIRIFFGFAIKSASLEISTNFFPSTCS